MSAWGRGRPGQHDRARELAAVRVDDALDPPDEAWLAGHLEACTACAEVAAEYGAQHGLFESLRTARLEPPRDLWARTSAAIEAERADRSRGRRGPAAGARPPAARSRLVPLVAVVAVALVAGVGLLNGRLAGLGAGRPGATPIAVAAAGIQVLARDSSGRVRILSRSVSEVCPVDVSSCGAMPTFAVTDVAGFESHASLQGAISPTGSQLVVVTRDTGQQAVYVVPIRPMAAPLPPAASPTEGTPSPAAATGSPAHAGPSAWAASPEPTVAAPTLTAEPATTPPPPPDTPTLAVSPDPSAPPPPESLSPDATTPRTAEPSSGPDGAIQIAGGIVVVGLPIYSPDGSRLAFAARPADGSAGPDIYAWSVGDLWASVITSDHASWLAGWTAHGILVSRVAGGVPTTVELDPLTGQAASLDAPGVWLPAVSPDGRTAAWWSGTVKLADDGMTWVPDAGRLVLGAWTLTGLLPQDLGAGPASAELESAAPSPQDLPTPPPTAPPPSRTPAAESPAAESPAAESPAASPSLQDLAVEPPTAWQVRWDDQGSVVAVWVERAGGDHGGRLSLFRVDAATGAADLASPMLDAVPANPDFSLRAGRLAWTAPLPDGSPVVEVLAWSGSAIGRLEVPTLVGDTVVR